MNRKNISIVLGFCAVAFMIGLVLTPLIERASNINLRILTDSSLVESQSDRLAELSTPPNGYHAWVSPKGNLYMGVWKDGDLHKGTLITDKSVYEGEFVGLSPHGYGTMFYNNGNTYRGNWSAGNKEGIGLKRNRDGSMFFGHWRAGLFNQPKQVNHKIEDRVYGIDISKWQPHNDLIWRNFALFSDSYGEVYSAVAENRDFMQPVTFAFIKATQGIERDPCYFRHLENARKHHVIVGSYHFFTIGDDIDGQIQNFIGTVKYVKGDLPPVLDLECEWGKRRAAYEKELRKYGIRRMNEEALKWLREVEMHYKVKPLIYTNRSWRRDFLKDPRFNDYEFWLSSYYNKRPKENEPWVFWQRSDSAIINGYQKRIDVNVFFGSFDRFVDFRNSLLE